MKFKKLVYSSFVFLLNQKSFSILFFILFGFTYLSSFFPYFALIPNHKQFSIIFLSFFSFINFVNNKLSVNERIIVGIIILLILYSFFISYIHGYFWLGNRYLELFSSFSIIYLVFGSRKSKFIHENFIKYFMLFTEILSLFVLINTINELSINPVIIRTIISQSEDSMELLSRGISGYNFFYFSILYTILNIGLLFNKSITSIKFSFIELFTKIIYIFLVLIMVFEANLLTGIFVLILGLFISLFLRIFSKINILTISFILIILLITGLILFQTNFFQNLILSFELDPFTTRRLLDLLQNLKTLDYTSLLLTRSYVLEMSIINIQKYFLLGSLLNNNLMINGIIVGFGEHSFILDTFAIYGFLFFSIFIFLIILIFKSIFKFSKKDQITFLPLFLCYFVLITFNNLTTSFNFIILLFLPLVIKPNKKSIINKSLYFYPNLIIQKK